MLREDFAGRFSIFCTSARGFIGFLRGYTTQPRAEDTEIIVNLIPHDRKRNIKSLSSRSQAKEFSFTNSKPVLRIEQHRFPIIYFCRVQIDDLPNRGIPM